MISRRILLASAASATFARPRARIDRSRLSVITDECATSPDDAISFAHQYGLKWVELRDVPGKKEGQRGYIFQPEENIRADAAALKRAKLRVSFLNTGLLKFTLPGTEPARARQETPEQRTARLAREQQQFDRRAEDLAKAIRCAEIFEARKIRVFTFTRVADPAPLLPKIASIVSELAPEARRHGMQLLVENEGSQNVATSAELAAFLDRIPDPTVAINWDPMNAVNREKPFPDGYHLLPKPRIANVQAKARGLVIGPDMLDWPGIFSALENDHYTGEIGLETHVFDGTLIEKAHLSMKELVRIAEHHG